MFERTILKMAMVSAVAAAAAVTVSSNVAFAAPSASLSFSSSRDGASAGWTSGKGSPIELTIGSSPGSYAIIDVHHPGNVTVNSLSEPTFSTDNYNAGSPRYYITLNDGNSLWGYPSNSGLNGSDFAWSTDNGNTYEPWSSVQSSEGSAKVTGVSVVADADQTAGTVDTITNLTFDGTLFN